MIENTGFVYGQAHTLHPSCVTQADVDDFHHISKGGVSVTLEGLQRVMTSCRIAVVRRSLIGKTGRIVATASLAHLDLLSGNAGIITNFFFAPIKDGEELLRLRAALIECLVNEADSMAKRHLAIVAHVMEGAAGEMYRESGFGEVVEGKLLIRQRPRLASVAASSA